MRPSQGPRSEAGRVCPADYRYAQSVFAREAEFRADTAYIIGGVYGNPRALDTIEMLAEAESGSIRSAMNGGPKVGAGHYVEWRWVPASRA